MLSVSAGATTVAADVETLTVLGRTDRTCGLGETILSPQNAVNIERDTLAIYDDDIAAPRAATVAR